MTMLLVNPIRPGGKTGETYFLAAQSVHVAEPVTVLYFPAAHAAHVPPFGPEYPKLQRQEPILVCDKSACPEFDVQLVHAAEPVAVLYFPAGSLGVDGFWVGDYWGGVRVGRPVGARWRSPARGSARCP
jgi:hypothetical protein